MLEAPARIVTIGCVIFRQVIHDDLGCASYLVGDESAGTAAVVDPRLDVEEYLGLARFMGVTIDHVLETHNHADHVSGHGRLAKATGATIHIHRLAEPEYEHEPFDDGWELELGDLIVRAIHTPGHRPEHTAFALVDRGRGDDPWALLTGDTLFVNGVARPDLAVEKEEGARDIFRSLRDRILTLPGHVEVWPGHLGGSMCGGPGMDMKVSTTLGFETLHNSILGVTGEDEFVGRAISGLGPQPPNFERIVAINRGPLTEFLVGAPPLEADAVQAALESGALLVDTRSELDYDEGHISGAVSVPATGAGFGTRLAWIADPETEIVLVGPEGEDARRVAGLAASVGIASLSGHLGGGMDSWRESGRPVERIDRLPVDRLDAAREADPELQVLDVRERSEWERGHVEGSHFTPWHDIRSVPEGVDAAAPVAVVCGSGERAGIAAGLLKRAGADRVIHVVDGGVPKWRRLRGEA